MRLSLLALCACLWLAARCGEAKAHSDRKGAVQRVIGAASARGRSTNQLVPLHRFSEASVAVGTSPFSPSISEDGSVLTQTTDDLCVAARIPTPIPLLKVDVGLKGQIVRTPPTTLGASLTALGGVTLDLGLVRLYLALTGYFSVTSTGARSLGQLMEQFFLSWVERVVLGGDAARSNPIEMATQRLRDKLDTVLDSAFTSTRDQTRFINKARDMFNRFKQGYLRLFVGVSEVFKMTRDHERAGEYYPKWVDMIRDCDADVAERCRPLTVDYLNKLGQELINYVKLLAHYMKLSTFRGMECRLQWGSIICDCSGVGNDLEQEVCEFFNTMRAKHPNIVDWPSLGQYNSLCFPQWNGYCTGDIPNGVVALLFDYIARIQTVLDSIRSAMDDTRAANSWRYSPYSEPTNVRLARAKRHINIIKQIRDLLDDMWHFYDDLLFDARRTYPAIMIFALDCVDEPRSELCTDGRGWFEQLLDRLMGFVREDIRQVLAERLGSASVTWEAGLSLVAGVGVGKPGSLCIPESGAVSTATVGARCCGNPRPGVYQLVPVISRMLALNLHLPSFGFYVTLKDQTEGVSVAARRSLEINIKGYLPRQAIGLGPGGFNPATAASNMLVSATLETATRHALPQLVQRVRAMRQVSTSSLGSGSSSPPSERGLQTTMEDVRTVADALAQLGRSILEVSHGSLYLSLTLWAKQVGSRLEWQPPKLTASFVLEAEFDDLPVKAADVQASYYRGTTIDLGAAINGMA